jgi:hypothetical protein
MQSMRVTDTECDCDTVRGHNPKELCVEDRRRHAAVFGPLAVR